MDVRPADSGGPVAEGLLATTDFVDCYQVHYHRVIRALRLAGADRSTAEDLAQEAFARALAKWGRVSRGTNPPGYVYTTAFRLLGRSRRPPPSGAAAAPAPAAEGAATLTVAVEAVLAAMPEKRRACAVMCLIVGLPTHEAATALGIADGTVRKHLAEARDALRASLSD